MNHGHRAIDLSDILTPRRDSKRHRFNDNLEVSQIQKTYTCKSGAIVLLTDGSFIHIRNIGKQFALLEH
uniref:Uncharacterized protein n=1 Tax=Ditylenchus dipsaci TaxID=166011 RepID=A0A915DHW1_9BILA